MGNEKYLFLAKSCFFISAFSLTASSKESTLLPNPARKASVRGADHEVDGTKVEEEHVGISTASKRQLKSE